MRTDDDSTSFLVRYLWTALVLLLVIGGLVVAMARGDSTQRDMHGATLADRPIPWVLQ